MTAQQTLFSPPPASAEAYFAEGEAWGQEVYDNARASVRRWRRVAAGALALAALAVGAVVALAPLKSTQPYVVLVDRTTGYMERVDRVDATVLTANEALIRADVVRFLQSHEVWDPTDFQERARFVRLSSTDGVYAHYLDTINRRAESLTLDDTREIHVKSVSLDPEESRAFVRFSTSTRVRGRTRTAHWAASLAYRYTTTPPERDTAFVNPLGFQVTRLRVDQESVRDTAPDLAPVVASASSSLGGRE